MTTSWHWPLSKNRCPAPALKNSAHRTPVLFARLLFFNSAFIGVKLWNLFGADTSNLIPLGLLGSFFRISGAFSFFNHLG
jgi:hypothetical protein